MKVATFSIAGERRVGCVDLDRDVVSPFDFSIERAESGILALIEANGSGPPATLSPIPLSAIEFEAPIPRPRRNIFCIGKNYFEHAHEFANSGFDSSAAAGAVPKNPIVFSKVPGVGDRDARQSSDRSQGLVGDRLRGGACGDHRHGGARNRQGQGA